MGAAASSCTSSTHSSSADQPKLLTVMLPPPCSQAAAAGAGALAATNFKSSGTAVAQQHIVSAAPAHNGNNSSSSSEEEEDDAIPRLVDDSPDYDDAATLAALHSSEVCRKSLMLPAASSAVRVEHVGRVLAVSDNRSSAASGAGAGASAQLSSGGGGSGTESGVVWFVPQHALSPPSQSPSPQAAAGSIESTAVLLSPTFILPCGLLVMGGGGGDVDSVGHQAQGQAATTTEWQLMLEPTNTPPSADGSNQGASGSGSNSRVQAWRPSLRFLGSPTCSSPSFSAHNSRSYQQQQPASGLAAAAEAAAAHVRMPGATPAHATCCGSSAGPAAYIASTNNSDTTPGVIENNALLFNTGSNSNSNRNSLGISDSSSLRAISSYQQHYHSDPYSTSSDVNMVQAGSDSTATGLNGGEGGEGGDSSSYRQEHSSSAGGSSMIRTKNTQNLEPAFFSKAAQSTGKSSSSSSDGGSSSSDWRLECVGRLAVVSGESADAPDAATGFNVQLQQLGATVGASFAFSCGSNSSNQIAAAATATPNAHHHTACSSELQVTVDFTHLRLLLGPDAATLGSNSTTTATARPHTGGHNTGSLTRVYDNNSSSSNSQTQSQHPLGASPPHTPNKTHSSSNGSAAAGSNGSNSSAAATTATAAAGGGVMSPPKPVAARQLEAVLLSHSPRMLVIDNFFLPELCTGLMELARNKLVRSRVASGSETPSRTSWGHFFVKDAAKHPLILEAESQIEALFASAAVRGGYGPLAKVEAIQVVRYHKGEFYHEHYDNKSDGPLTRAATILVYLCDTEEGGATSFSRAVTGFGRDPEADAALLPPKVTVGPGGRGVKIFPVRGRALVFWSKRPNGDEDPNSIHAAETVMGGEKWIATRWMKDAQ